jgi:hypothetical protein
MFGMNIGKVYLILSLISENFLEKSENFILKFVFRGNFDPILMLRIDYLNGKLQNLGKIEFQNFIKKFSTSRNPGK